MPSEEAPCTLQGPLLAGWLDPHQPSCVVGAFAQAFTKSPLHRKMEAALVGPGVARAVQQWTPSPLSLAPASSSFLIYVPQGSARLGSL